MPKTQGLLNLNQFTKEAGFKKYFHNTGWLFAEKALRLLSGLVIGVIVARFLGPEQFGLLNFALSFVGLFLALSGLGLDSILVREIVKSPEKSGLLLGTSFRLKLFAGIAVFLLLIGAIFLLPYDPQMEKMILVIGLAGIFQSFSVIDFYFQAKVESKYVVQSNVIALSVSAIAKLILVWLEAPLFYFAAVFSLDALIVAIGLVMFYLKKGKENGKWSYNISVAKGLLNSSWPLILAGLVVTVYMKIDQIMITELLDAEANGNYSAAVRISEAWYFIPMVLCSSLFPAILNSKKREDGSYMKRLQHLYDLMVVISFSVAIPITFLSDWIIEMLFGEAYLAAADVLTIHIWSGAFVALGIASSNWLISEDLQKLSMLRTTLGAVVNIILNFILIPIYGIVGAAMTTLVSQITAAFIFDLFYKRTRDNFVMKLKSLLLLNIISKLMGIEK